jgi:hypothetical protein
MMLAWLAVWSTCTNSYQHARSIAMLATWVVRPASCLSLRSQALTTEIYYADSTGTTQSSRADLQNWCS